MAGTTCKTLVIYSIYSGTIYGDRDAWADVNVCDRWMDADDGKWEKWRAVIAGRSWVDFGCENRSKPAINCSAFAWCCMRSCRRSSDIVGARARLPEPSPAMIHDEMNSLALIHSFSRRRRRAGETLSIIIPTFIAPVFVLMHACAFTCVIVLSALVIVFTRTRELLLMFCAALLAKMAHFPEGGIKSTTVLIGTVRASSLPSSNCWPAGELCLHGQRLPAVRALPEKAVGVGGSPAGAPGKVGIQASRSLQYKTASSPSSASCSVTLRLAWDCLVRFLKKRTYSCRCRNKRRRIPRLLPLQEDSWDPNWGAD